ncbi:MAG: hypothetical protein IPL60_12175 [Ardenticatenia bacterium]|nr:hypothetical protein [Ardenticatenia bacterium]
MSRANVRSIQSLRDLKSDLACFGGDSRAALQRMEMESRRTQEWLDERQRHWEGHSRRCQEAVRQAQTAVQRCQASGSRDPKTGREYVPDCRGPEGVLRQAQSRLDEAQAQLNNVRRWTRAVQEAGEAYQRQARRMATLLEDELVKSQVFLERRLEALEAYAALGRASTFGTQSPMQFAADTVANAMALGAMGLPVVAMGVLKWMAGPLRQTLGDSGEALSARLLGEEHGWEEVAFDQPKHGFDRLFSAPGLPLVVVESKVHGRGRFHLGQTRSGEQGSAEWIAAMAAKMADPDSAQWSPENERIAALIHEIGPENIPTVAVVIETESGRASVHYRQAGSIDWQTLEDGIVLHDVLKPEARDNRG